MCVCRAGISETRELVKFGVSRCGLKLCGVRCAVARVGVEVLGDKFGGGDIRRRLLSLALIQLSYYASQNATF